MPEQEMQKIEVNPDRAEIRVRLGGDVRVLRFKGPQVVALEKALETDPLVFLARGGGETLFCQQAVLAGISYDVKQRREAGAETVANWLDDQKDLDREDLMKEVLYCIGRGKTGQQAKRWMKILDDMFAHTEGDRSSPGPSSGA